MRPRRLAIVAALVCLGASLAMAESDPLAEKAAAFRAGLVERHLMAEGLVLYRLDLRAIAESVAGGPTLGAADTPTFNGMLAAGACRGRDLELAERALAGLRALMDVTGVPGLLARSMRRSAPTGLSGEWHRGSGAWAGWWWRGDVSMDQYANGLVPAVEACRDAFPELTRDLVRDAADHLLRNEMEIRDVDGTRTTYGLLSPRAGFGFNGIAKLTGYAIVALAAEHTLDARFVRHRDALRRSVAGATRTNVRFLGITNHSNDLMALHVLYALIRSSIRTADPLLDDFRDTLDRVWTRVRADQNAYFTGLYCELEPGACPLAELASAHRTLARFPLEKRKLAPRAELADIPRRCIPGRKFARLARDVVPIEWRPVSSFEWKSSPFRVTGDAAEFVEYTGIDFLVAYWQLRAVVDERTTVESGSR